MEVRDIPIARIPLFSGIDAENAVGLFGCMNACVECYQRNDYIRSKQAGGPYVGIVLSGAAHMMKEDAWGHQLLIAHLGEGDILGESNALHAGGDACISFVAAQPSQILFLSIRHLLHPCKEQCPYHLTLAQNMFDLLLEKNARLTEHLEVLSKKSLRDKILTYLSLQSQKQSSRYVTIPINRTEMASYLQSNRSAMTRELASMKDEGLIDYDGNTFTLL